MDIYLEDELIHRQSLKSFTYERPDSILWFLSKIKNEEDTTKLFRFNVKLSLNPDSHISYDETVEYIELINGIYHNIQSIKINKLNKYIIELNIVGLIPDVIGFLMVCDLSEDYLDLLDIINYENTIVRYLLNIKHERIESFTINHSFIIKYLMEFNKIETYKTAFDHLDCLNITVKRQMIDIICNKIYGFSVDELLKTNERSIDKLSIDNINTDLLDKIVRYVEDKYE